MNALTLSDVTDAKDNQFAPGILEGIRSVQQSSSKGPSAKQKHPSNAMWPIWRRLLAPHLWQQHAAVFPLMHPQSLMVGVHSPHS
jgi:hypothetical protein